MELKDVIKKGIEYFIKCNSSVEYYAIINKLSELVWPHCVNQEEYRNDMGVIIFMSGNYGSYFNRPIDAIPLRASDFLTAPAPDLLPNYKRMYEMLEMIHLSITGGGDVVTFQPHHIDDLQQLLLTAKID